MSHGPPAGHEEHTGQGHGHGHGRVDVVRKGAVVVLLLGGLVLLHRFVGTPTEAVDPRGLLALGFVVLAAHAIGELAEVFKLPHITGYLLAGLVLGPSAAQELGQLLPSGLLPAPFDHGVLNEAVIGQLAVLDILALPLICLTAGGELDLGNIKKGFRTIASVLGSQLVILMLVFAGFLWAISGAVPGLGLPALEGVSGPGILALAGALAAIAFATSTAATIAIIVGTGSKGSLTNILLSVVVLKDVIVVVMFAAFTALAAGLIGAGEPVSFATSVLKIVQSVLIGVGVGGLIHLYLRYVNAELLLFLVALIFGVSWVAQIVHGEIALIFIAAGFVVGNVSDRGDPLIKEVERLSLPVYVVFFTLAGARLHLDVIAEMAWFAVALVVLRTAALWLGTRVGTQLGGADESTKKYAWLGMLSQAGLSISLASQLPILFPGELGEGLFALVLAGVAVHEVVGPALLQAGLSLAGETAEKRQAPVVGGEAEDAFAEAPTGPVDLEEGTADDPWAPAFRSASPELERVVGELEEDLRAAVEVWRREVAAPVAREHVRWLGDLRREFLREHRRLLARVRSDSADPELVADAFAELGRTWRGLVLARAAAPAARDWRPMGLAARLDGRVDGLPATILAPVEEASLEPREEPPWRALRRWWLRARGRVSELKRQVGVRDLARFHLSGHGVGHLEGLAALGVEAELMVMDGVADAYAVLTRGHTALAQKAEADELSAVEAEGLLWEMRQQVEERLHIAQELAERLPQLAEARASTVLGRALADLKEELGLSGTLDLSNWSRRMGRAYAHRNRGIQAATVGLADAVRALGARHQALALELEVTSMEVEIARELEHQGASVERLCRELALRQAEAALERLEEAEEAFREGLESELAAGELAERIREVARGAQRQLREAQRLVTHLQGRLAEEVGVVPLRDALVAACGGLTEVYEVPQRPLERGSWTLAQAVPTTQRRLRELSLAYVETTVAAALEGRRVEHTERYAALGRTLAETERVLSFNADLSVAELEVRPGEPPAEAVLGLLDEMLFGAVGRARGRLAEAVQQLEGAPAELRAELEEVVHKALDRLRTVASTGEVGDLRRLLVLEAVARGQALQQAGLLRQPLTVVLRQVLRRGEEALGPHRAGQVRDWLGAEPASSPAVDLRPPPARKVPQIYQRLFRSSGLGGAGQIIGREAELDLARRTLALGGSRGVLALVGPAGTGTTAISAALWDSRGQGEPRRIRVDGPVGREEIDQWFEDGAAPTELTGLGWLFGLQPGGADALEHFMRRLLGPERKAPWVLCANEHIWETACGLAPLAEAVSGVVRVGPLDRARLEEALLARHRMSAYTLEFRAPGSSGRTVELPFRRRSQAERRRRDWFEDLHRESGGLMSDAMRLWIQAVDSVDTEAGVVRMGPVPRAPRQALAALGTEELLTLRQALRQGWLDPGLLGATFRIGRVAAEARLAGLVDRGLLVRMGDRCHVSPHLRRALVQVLEERGWAA